MVLIGAQVTMILALVGVSRGVLGNMAQRAKGTGADIVVRSPDSNILSYGLNMPDKVVGVIRELDHVKLATGVLVHAISSFDNITGIHLDEFNELSGGFTYLSGGPFKNPTEDLFVDRNFANKRQLKVGEPFEFGHKWNITGIVEGGKLAATFADIEGLQEVFGEPNKISMVYVKADDPKNIPIVIKALENRLKDFKIYSMEDFLSLFTVDSVQYLGPFINVVIGIGAIVGFLVTLLSMYMAVQERTREIGILKAMGASPGYILGILLRETVVLSLAGVVLGIVMAYGTRALLAQFAPTMPQMIVPEWYPWVTLIAVGGSLVGAVYPGLKAAKQDAIEALAYD
jgi:putative ABC transport system permease protein